MLHSLYFHNLASICQRTCSCGITAGEQERAWPGRAVETPGADIKEDTSAYSGPAVCLCLRQHWEALCVFVLGLFCILWKALLSTVH